MPDNRLTPLQREFLESFFHRETQFFLTGGAALAGFHLGHRETEDLDLFVASEALDILDEADLILGEVATELRATLEATRSFRDYRRRLISRSGEALVIDLVRDPTPQLIANKPLRGIVRVDPPEEIFANKLCTLLSRSELRDLVDVRALERSGLDLATGVANAARKDAGLTPGALAWVLSEITISADANPPGGVSAEELRGYVRTLCDRLDRMAFPK